MTEAEAHAVLTAFDTSMRIIRTTSRYNYAAGEDRPENLSTPEFLDRLEAQPAGGGFELCIVYFATPPSFAEPHQIVWEEAGKLRCAYTRRGNRPYVGHELSRNRIVPTFHNERRYQSLGLTLASDPAACGQISPIAMTLERPGARGQRLPHRPRGDLVGGETRQPVGERPRGRSQAQGGLQARAPKLQQE